MSDLPKPGTPSELTEAEAAQILQESGDPDLPDEVFTAVEQILASRLAALVERPATPSPVAGEESDSFSKIPSVSPAAAAREFANWVSTQRAYNGSEHEHGQSLYNECINAVLPTWAEEWAAERGQSCD